MMTCQDVHGEIRRFIDGTMPWGNRVRVRMHLLMCRSCRRYLRQLRSTDKLVLVFKDDSPPSPELEKKLVDIFRAERAQGNDQTEK